MKSIPQEQYAKGFLGEPLSRTMKQLWLNRIRLTDQTKLLHWIAPEDDVVLGSYSHENIKQCM